MRTARILFCLVTLSLLLAACGQQSAPTPVGEDLDLVLRVEPEPPSVGQATLIATLKDANGLPVDGARLLLHGDMDHEGMTQVDLETSESLGGEYRIPFEWTMGGGWIVTVTAQTPAGGEISETLNVFVGAVSTESIINR